MEKKFLIFRLSDEAFAVELKHSREIIPFSAPKALPSMPDFLEGLIHLRGFFLPLICTKKLLGIKQTGKEPLSKKKEKIIIISVFKKIVGLRIDDVDDITIVESDKILPAPSLISDMNSNYYSGGFYLKNKVILVLDIEKLFTEKVLTTNLPAKEKKV